MTIGGQFYFTIYTTNSALSEARQFLILLVVPVLSSPLIFTYLVNERVVMTIGGYINHDLHNRLKISLSKDVVLGWDDYHTETLKSFFALLIGFFSKTILFLATLFPLLTLFYKLDFSMTVLQGKLTQTMQILLVIDIILIFVILIGIFNNSYLFTRVTKKMFRSRAKIISELLRGRISPGSRVLDIGSGPGIVSLQIAKNYDADMYCLDVKDEHRVDLPFTLYDGQHIPFPDESFDTALLIFTLHHADNPEQVLAEARRVCRGRIIIIEDRYNSLFGWLLLVVMDSLLNVLTINRQTKLPFKFETVEGWKEEFRKLGLSAIEVKQSVPRLSPFDFAPHAVFVVEPEEFRRRVQKAA